MPSTIQQVAQQSGVTRGTASRILGGHAHLYRPETRDRVVQAARDLGYQPDRLARALVTGKTKLVAVHVVWLHTQFYARISSTLEQQATAHGYGTLIQKLPEDVPLRGEGVPQVSWPVDGELVIDGGPRFAEASTALNSHMLSKRPMVSLGVFCMPQVDHVQVDVYRAASEAFEHLRGGGRRRIAYMVDEPTFLNANEPMIHAYRDYTKRKRIKPCFIRSMDRSPANLREAAARFFQSTPVTQRPDAVFCHGDIVAHVLLRVLKDLGIQVPRDVAIIGCGGNDETEFQSPSITTIQMPVVQMCEQAWAFLENRMAEPQIPLQHAMLPAELVVRESSLS